MPPRIVNSVNFSVTILLVSLVCTPTKSKLQCPSKLDKSLKDKMKIIII